MCMHLDTNIPFSHQKVVCDWCSNSLANIRNVYKGINCERQYCSRECHQKGEDRALRYKAALAGTISSHWLLGVAAILIMFILAFTFTGGSKAWAQDVDGTVHQVHPGHAAHHNIYKNWTQSNGYSSCCNGDDPENGVKGDCRPARAYPDQDGQWHVLINGKYVPVPLHAIRDYPTPDGNSHVCETPSQGIMCFVRGLPKS